MATDKDKRAAGRGQGTRSRERGAGSVELGARSREQGAERRQMSDGGCQRLEVRTLWKAEVGRSEGRKVGRRKQKSVGSGPRSVVNVVIPSFRVSVIVI